MDSREKPFLYLCGRSKAGTGVDVVFVHGLTGDYRDTWTAKKNKAAAIFWPDALAKELGDRVNVWSLAYDAPLLKLSEGSRLKETLGQDAIERLSVIARAPNGERQIGERPIVFVTHSLGGLVVKAMLRQADEARPKDNREAPSDLDCIRRQTRAVVFIATPHCGTSLVYLKLLAPLLARVGAIGLGLLVAIPKLLLTGLALCLSFLIRPSKYVDELVAEDPYLRELQNFYRKFSERMEIQTSAFYERKKYWLFRVVSPCSADPGLPTCTPTGIDNHHVGITKISTVKESTIYREVLSLVQNVERKAGAGKIVSVFEPTLDQDILDLLNNSNLERLRGTLVHEGKLRFPRKFEEIHADGNLRVAFEEALRQRIRSRLENKTLSFSAATVMLAEQSPFDLDKYILYLWREHNLTQEMKTLRRCVAKEADVIKNASGVSPSLIPLFRTVRAVEHAIEDDLQAMCNEVQQAQNVINMKQSDFPELDGGHETSDLLKRLDAGLTGYNAAVKTVRAGSGVSPQSRP